MGCVHHLLSSEVPDVNCHLRPVAHWKGAVADLNAFRRPFANIKLIRYKRFDQRGFAYSSLDDEYQFGFIQGLGGLLRGEVVVENGFRSFWLLAYFCLTWAKHFVRKSELWVVM